MDGKKIEAINYRYKRPNYYYFLDFYSISTALACTLFCCLTLSLPYLSSMVSSVYMSSSLLMPVLLSSKLLFIITNLIIVVLMRNSKILINSSSEYYYSSSNSHVYYDEYIQSSTTHLVPDPTNLEVIKKDKTFWEEGSMDMMIMKPWGDQGGGGGGGGGVVMKSTKKTTTQKWTAKKEDKGDGQSSNLVADELNKRAEDFIARVNRHRRLELSLLQYGSSY